MMNKEGREAQRQFETQMESQDKATDMQYLGQMAGSTDVAMDSQVSAMLLQVPRRFLKYSVDPKTGEMVRQEKFNYIEPYMDESLSFLMPEEIKLINQIDNTLSLIYRYKRNPGPPICLFSFPETLRMLSRISSADKRRRGNRHKNRASESTLA